MALQPVDTDTTTTDATTYKGNDIDSDGDGKVDAADDADTVGGEPPGNFADAGHTHTGGQLDPDELTASSKLTVPVYADKGSVPAQPEGSLVYVSGDGLYIEDNT